MDAVTFLRTLFANSHDIAEQVIDGTTTEQAHATPGGHAHSIAATYVHMVVGEDVWTNSVAPSKPSLIATDWAGKTGLSDETQPPADWENWARTIEVDLPTFRAYAKAVYAATDVLLASLKPEDLDRVVDSGFAGPQTIAWLLCMMAVHTSNHAGENAAVKGILGLKGYSW